MSILWYRPAPFYLLRVPTLPSTLFTTLSLNGHLNCSSEQDLEAAWRHANQTCLMHLKELATLPLVEQALLTASPSLYEALRRLHQQKDAESRRALRAYERLLRYLVRMCSRPTPFGYCAGVAFGTFASESHIILEGFEETGRPDMQWLFTLLAEVETRLLPFLDVQVSPALLTFGDARGIGLRHGNNGEASEERLWFHLTSAFRRLWQDARMPMPYADLKDALLADFPQATEGQIETFLHELYTTGVLLSTLKPSDEQDPLRYVLDILRPLVEASVIVEQLEAIQEAIRSAPHRLHALSTLIQQQRALTPQFEGRTTLQVDTRLRLSQNTLSTEVSQEAVRVAEILLRLGMYPQGLSSLYAARRIFLERYEQQEVPLLTLFAPQGGFDTLYATESDPRDLPKTQQERWAQRTHLLRTLAMQAINAREHSIFLTPELVERLSLWSPSDDALPPPLLDLYMQVYADSSEAMDRGDWQGLVTLLSLGGRSYHRFLHLFGSQEQTIVRTVLQAGDALFPEYLHATLAVLPPNIRDLNVMHGPRWSAYEIPINRASSRSREQTILPDDILVSVRNGRFCLRDRIRNKAVRVTQPHMLSFLHLPPLARFLLEASRDGEAFPSPFQWGSAGRLPFLPRITLGKVIISLTQWTLSHDVLTKGEREAEGVQWFRVLQRWREQWRIPRYVYLVEGEDRLLLDLEHTLMVDLLRQELTGKRSVILQEAPFHERKEWLRDREGNPYISEIVVPLIRTVASPPPSLPSVAPQVIAERARCFLPGQEWLYLKLYGPEALHQDVFTSLSLFIQEHQSLWDTWFFLRYHDPLAHIRLRFHATNDSQRARLLQTVLAWTHELQRQGIITRCVLDVYERETERYGGPEAIQIIERVFCANSEVVCTLLTQRQGTHPLLFEVVYALECLWTNWGYDLSARYAALQRHLPPAKESQTVRKLRQPLLAFLERPPDALSALFDTHGLVLAQAGRAIRELAEHGALWRTEDEILWSLSHLLCNRILGTDHEREQEAYAAWYATLKVCCHTSSSQ